MPTVCNAAERIEFMSCDDSVEIHIEQLVYGVLIGISVGDVFPVFSDTLELQTVTRQQRSGWEMEKSDGMIDVSGQRYDSKILHQNFVIMKRIESR